MDYNLLTLFVELKGLKESSLILDIPEGRLVKFLGQTGTHSSNFFKQVVECIKNLRSTTSLEATSEYFVIPAELVKVLTEENYSPPFLDLAKNLIQNKFDSKCNKHTQTKKNEFQKNTETLSQNSSAHCPQPTQAFLPKPNFIKNSTSNPSIPSVVPNTHIPGVLPNQPVEQAKSIPLPVPVRKTLSPLIKKLVVLSLLQDHRPTRGSIMNPDYSYPPS